jgi:hypothetical protein
MSSDSVSDLDIVVACSASKSFRTFSDTILRTVSVASGLPHAGKVFLKKYTHIAIAVVAVTTIAAMPRSQTAGTILKLFGGIDWSSDLAEWLIVASWFELSEEDRSISPPSASVRRREGATVASREASSQLRGALGVASGADVVDGDVVCCVAAPHAPQ